jgi:SPP1 gp7 family putative phage head morphogenesis protein
VALLKLGLNVAFKAAIDAAEKRRALMPQTYYALPGEIRAQSFTVSGLAAIDQVQSVLDELKRTLDQGGTLKDFQGWAAKNDVGLPRHRLETVFRNGVQQAYNAGHWRRFEEDASERPYLMYDAINDSRTRPAHRALDGVIRPVGDPFWNTHSPQLSFNCRCRLLSLGADEARSRGGVTQNPPAEGQPDAGWGHKPTGQRAKMGAVIAKRQAVCTVAKFAPGASATPIWCAGQGAKLLAKLARAAAQVSQRRALPALTREIAINAMARDSMRRHAFAERFLNLGPIAPSRELFDASGEDERALFIGGVSLQASYLRRLMAKPPEDRIEMRVLQFAYDAAKAGGFTAAEGTAKGLIANVYPVSGTLYRWVWEVRTGRRALVLRDVRRA